ncbi:MAG: hypothetical protein H7196_01550 [candidate division SR1 bacterium]|nr:hypothetical protein [candidate division SR1 bacterium]
MNILPSIIQVTIENFGNSNLDFSLVGDFIDYGGQYKVFAYGVDKVIKIPMTKEEILCRIVNWGHETPDFEAKYQQLVSSRDRAIELVNTSKVPANLLGNFEIHNQIIIQDKVEVWNKVFVNLDEITQKNYLLQVVNLYIEQWIYGLHEYIYNFSINCGIDYYGNVILIDFGEITDNKNRVLQDINEGKILNACSTQSLPTNLQQFYAKHVIETLTMENLNLYWRSSK